MQLSTKARYAVIAMVDLATRQAVGCECGPICIAEIAARQQLSPSYLEQLFGKLRRAGLVASARGPGGGYRLARPSDQIAIGDIIAAVNEPIRTTRCHQGGASCIDGLGETRCQTHDLWFELGRQIEFFFGAITLADVVNRNVAGRAIRLSLTPSVASPAATAETAAAAE
jgi:Rrf2 family iron-sulfur cluster assembly transcriptional regulator